MNFNFFYKPKKKPKENLDSDLLLPQDKKEIKKLTEVKSKQLQNISEINHKITLIQNSTGTLVPQFVRLHNNLRAKYKWYYNWHTKPYAKSVHWLVLLLYLIALPLTYYFLSPSVQRAQATTYDFPRWEWTNPTPTGNGLNGVWAYNQSNIWAIGAAGSILKYNGTSWNQIYSETANTLYGISGSDASNIWTVGDNGTILKYNGSSWSQQTSGTTELLYGVSVLDENNVWAVGNTGTILKYDGSSWTSQTSGTTAYLKSVSALNSDNVWAVGQFGIILKYDGVNWTTQGNAPWTLNSVHASDSNNVWAVGNYGTIMKFDGTSWVQQTGVTTDWFLSVFTLDINNVWAVDWNGTVFKYDGSSWSSESSGSTEMLQSIFVLSANNIHVVGGRGTILHYNGSSWINSKSNIGSGFNNIFALDSSNVWAVGDNGTILKYNGSSWSQQTSGTTYTLNAIFALDANNVWAVGHEGTILYYNGSSWSSQPSGTTDALWDVFALDTNNVWVVGSGYTVLNYNGTLWIPHEVGGDLNASYYGVTATDTNNVWIVGTNGYIKKYNGTTWTPQNSGTTYAFREIYSLDVNNIWAVGALGTISKYDGTSWSLQTSYTTKTLQSVYALNINNIWAVGFDGTIIKSNGTEWISQTGPASWHLYDIFAIDTTNIWVAGVQNTILHYTSPPNATATKLSVHLPGQDNFSDGNAITGTPTSVKAGDSVSATIYAVDANNNLDKGNASYAGFTTTDPNDANPGTIQLTQGGTCVQTNRQPGDPECGIGTANFIFHTAGSWTVAASDVYGVLSSGTSSSITVTAGDPAKLGFSSFPTSLNLGSASSAITVGVKDAFGNATTVSGSKTIRLSTNSGDGRFSTSPNGPWTKDQLDTTISSGSGSTTFYYLDFRTGSSTITAAKTPDAGWTNASGTIAIGPGTLSQSTLSLSGNSLSSCSGSIAATVTLKNSEGLALTNRTIELQSSRGTTDTISPTSAITNSSGMITFTISSSSAGDLTLTAYNQTDNLYLPQSQDIHVTSSDLAKINLTSSASTVTAGSPFNVTATMANACDGTMTDYTGKVQFTSSDSEAEFRESNHTFSSSESGQYTQSVTLNTLGEQSINVSAGGITGTTSVTVGAGATATPDAGTLSPRTSPSTIVPLPITTEETQSLVETFQASPVAQAISKVLTPITAVAATLGLFPLLVQAFPQGFHILASLFPTIFTAAAIRRRRKPWGNVYDSLTGKPVDLAIVRVFNATNDRLVATKVTDENGRFNFMLAKGKYYVKVVKSGFSFPPKISKLKASQLATRFGPQSDIYFGQSFVIGEDDTNLNLNIALDPKLSTLSLGTRLLMWTKNGLDWFLIALSYFAIPLMLVGAAFAALATVIIPTRFNLYMSGAYGLLLVAYLISSRIKAARIGIVFNAKTRRPIIGATVLIFDKEYNAIREIKTTDQHGHFAILAQRGQYYLTVHAQGYKFPSKEFKFQKGDKKLGTLYLGQTINNKKAGFVNVSIPIDKD